MLLGVVSDLHHTPRPAPGLSWHGPFDVAGALPRLREGLAWFAEQRVDAVAVLGDLSQDGDEESLDAVLAALAEGWDGPAFVVAGNHDTLLRDDAVTAAVARLGDDRIRMAGAGAELGGFRLAGPGTGLAGTGDAPLIVLSHYPLLSRADAFAARGLAYAGDLPDGARIAAALAARPAPTLVLNGHLHARDDHRQGPVRQITVGPLVEAPYEVSIFELAADGAELTVELQVRELAGGAAA